LEQLIGAITNIDLEKFGGVKGLKGAEQDAGQMLQAEALAAVNQITDIGLGSNLGTAQDALSEKTAQLATLFGNLIDGIDVEKTAELPKVVETFTTNVKDLGTQLNDLTEASKKLTTEVALLEAAAYKAKTALQSVSSPDSIDPAPFTGPQQ
jgi:hypothetical protein